MRWLTLIMLVAVVGCAKYQTMSLQPLNPDFHDSALTSDKVYACCEVLDATASKRYFNKNLRLIGFQPVQFTISNESQQTYLLDLDSINLNHRARFCDKGKVLKRPA